MHTIEMTDMKRAKIEQEGGTLLSEGVDSSREDYAYGLKLHLDEPEMKKITLESPEIGTNVMIHAVGKIVSLSSDDNGRSMTIQITSLGVADSAKIAEGHESERTNVLYPGAS